MGFSLVGVQEKLGLSESGEAESWDHVIHVISSHLPPYLEIETNEKHRRCQGQALDRGVEDATSRLVRGAPLFVCLDRREDQQCIERVKY